MSAGKIAWEEAAEFLFQIGCNGSALRDSAFWEEAQRFLGILLEKNQVLNLTGAKDLETLFWKHLVDSLTLLSFPDLGVVVDWGCGGGFPGVPLALARKYERDETPVFFVDSISKKVRAVEEFCQRLDLSLTQGFVGRGEVLIRSGQLRKAQAVVMRAVAPAERAHKWISPEIPNWIFFLGPKQRDDWERELPKLAQKKIIVRDERSFALPHDLGQRCLLRLSKSST